jgi:hypothetical protein
MTQLDAILTQLPGWVGTARQLAERAGRDPRDSTFKRALAQATEEGVIFKSGEVFHQACGTSARISPTPPATGAC